MTKEFRARVLPRANVVLEGPCSARSSSSFNGRTLIGAYTYFGAECEIGSGRIGRFCSFASSIKMSLGEHPVDTVSTHPIFYGASNGFEVPSGIGTERDLTDARYRPTIVGNDVWVGANALIARGVTIGTGAVIAAGAVVVQDVPAYAIVGGVPAKTIRMRFDEPTVNLLLQSRWWDFPIDMFVGLDVKNVKSFAQCIIDLRLSGAADAVYKRVRVEAR